MKISNSRKVAMTATGRRLTVLLAAVILTTDGGEGAPAGGEEGAPAGGDGGVAGGEGAPADGGEGGNPSEDLASLFSAEEIQAQRERVAATKAEEERRAGLTEEQRAEEDRLKAEAEAANKVPEEYADFSVVDGIVLDPEMIAQFKPLAKELGLNQANAQKLVDLAVQVQQRTIDGIFAMNETRKAEWLKSAQEDEEIGADVKLWDPAKPGSASASVTLRAYNSIAEGVPGLKKMVDETGIGNHPDFLRVFYRIGTRMREDTFEGAGGAGAGAGEKKSAAKTLWPNMN